MTDDDPRPDIGTLMIWSDPAKVMGLGRTDFGVVVSQKPEDDADDIRVFWAGADGAGSCNISHKWPRDDMMVRVVAP